MRATVLMAVVALGLPFPASAETLDQRYFSLRDTAVAKVTAAMDVYAAMPLEPRKDSPTPANTKITAQEKAKTAAQDRAKAAALDKAKAAALDKVTAIDKAERAKLEAELREIVGPMPIAGFDGEGKLNLDHLIKGDQGFSALDGLIFTSTDKNASIIVTTTGIFLRWLAEHKDWWAKTGNNIPQQPGIAVQQNAFYTQALATDSAIVALGELHIRKPLGSVFVFARMGGRTQDAIPQEANEIFIAVNRKGRVFVGQSKIATVGPVTRCEDARKAALDYRPSTDKKAKDLEAAFLKCFSGWARYQPN